jgi:hypothetical protein
MSDINFNIVEESIVFDIKSENINFSISDQTLVFEGADANAAISFDITEQTLEFLLGEGATVLTNTAAIAYASEADIVSDSLIYKGEAFPGTLTSEYLWRISRITISGAEQDQIKIEWVNGESLFEHSWLDRYSLTYS